MTEPIFSDNAMRSIQFALSGLTRRQEVIGQNLANVDTPGYLAKKVNFEDALRVALKDTDQIRMNVTHSKHLAAPAQQAQVHTELRQGGARRADSNDVDPDIELNQLTETGIRFQALTQMATKKLTLLRTIAASR